MAFSDDMFKRHVRVAQGHIPQTLTYNGEEISCTHGAISNEERFTEAGFFDEQSFPVLVLKEDLPSIEVGAEFIIQGTTYRVKNWKESEDGNCLNINCEEQYGD